jgi:hypothetical protein
MKAATLPENPGQLKCRKSMYPGEALIIIAGHAKWPITQQAPLADQAGSIMQSAACACRLRWPTMEPALSGR